MDYKLNYENYKCLKILSDNSVAEIVETEFALPEYMPEILRIIKSVAEPKISSCRIVGERVTADGTCELRIIYTADDGGIYTFSQSRPFTAFVEKPEFLNADDVGAKIRVSYVNCRATGTKRAEIKAGLSVKFSVFCAENESLIVASEESIIQQKTTALKAMSLGCRKTRTFSMSDTVSLNTPSAFLVSTNASAICTEIRKISSKIMIKGDAVVEICYVNSADKSVTEHIKHSIPINQILEYEGMDEKFDGSVFLNVSALEVIPKGEGTGNSNAFDISLSVDASASMWKEKEIIPVIDAYSVETNIDLKKSPTTFFVALDNINDSFIIDEKVTVSGENVVQICDSVGEVSVSDIKIENKEIIVTGNLSLSMIVKDNADNFSGVNKILDYNYKRMIDYECNEIAVPPEITLISLDCLISGENTVSIRAVLSVNGAILGRNVIDCVSDITESDKPLYRNNNAITVYFPLSNDESLWTIARRYNTTVKAIARENCLEGETTENLKMLFIPSA